MSRFITGILTLFALFTAPLILSVAFLFLIRTLCTTGSGGGETRGEEDRERVGAAAGGGEARSEEHRLNSSH